MGYPAVLLIYSIIFSADGPQVLDSCEGRLLSELYSHTANFMGKVGISFLAALKKDRYIYVYLRRITALETISKFYCRFVDQRDTTHNFLFYFMEG